MSLVEIRDLHLEIDHLSGTAAVLHGVNLSVKRGELLGLVGETGSGKTLTAMSILRLLPAGARLTKGQIIFQGKDLLAAPEAEIRALRGRGIGMVFQQARSALHPTRPVLHQVEDRLIDRVGLKRREARVRALELLTQVGIPDPKVRGMQYPHQLSGGMCQRVMIAAAIAAQPQLLIADEPTTGLDVTLQLQIMQLITDLAAHSGTAVILITHDLALVSETCQSIAVMYAGEVVETGPTREVLSRPEHPYTRGLVRAVTSLEQGERPEAMPGIVPRFSNAPTYCPFADRCPDAIVRCRVERPVARAVGSNRLVACHLADRRDAQC